MFEDYSRLRAPSGPVRSASAGLHADFRTSPIAAATRSCESSSPTRGPAAMPSQPDDVVAVHGDPARRASGPAEPGTAARRRPATPRLASRTSASGGEASGVEDPAPPRARRACRGALGGEPDERARRRGRPRRAQRRAASQRRASGAVMPEREGDEREPEAPAPRGRESSDRTARPARESRRVERGGLRGAARQARAPRAGCPRGRPSRARERPAALASSLESSARDALGGGAAEERRRGARGGEDRRSGREAVRRQSRAARRIRSGSSARFSGADAAQPAAESVLDAAEGVDELSGPERRGRARSP